MLFQAKRNSGGTKSYWPVQERRIGFTKMKKSIMKVIPMNSHIRVKAHTDVYPALIQIRNIISMLKEMVSEKESFHFLTCVSCSCCSNTWCLLPPVCENCFELDGNTLFMVIVGDLLLTIIVMVIVYRCTKKKSPAGPLQPSKGKKCTWTNEWQSTSLPFCLGWVKGYLMSFIHL